MTDASAPQRKSLQDRLAEGPVVCAEGYLFELERRGYLQAGAFVPEVVLEHPEVVKQLHRDFVHAGSDVTLAFTYYGHREKLRQIGLEHMLEPLNRGALRIAREVAYETGTLLAGNICNTNLYDPDDQETLDAARAMFEEQVAWAAEEGAEAIVAETFSYTGEALMALEAIKAAGLPAVVTMAMHREPETRDGDTMAQACRRLEQAGADVVGLNCIRGPATMLEPLKQIRQAVSVPVAALPVPYRTSEQEPTFQSLSDAKCSCEIPDGRPFPVALDPLSCNRYEIAQFTRDARAIGVDWLGLCCGAQPHLVRAMAEALGKQPAASRYSPDMSKHAYFGTEARAKNQAYAGKL
jgi:betaine-homocysteine S-methyltransferase